MMINSHDELMENTSSASEGTRVVQAIGNVFWREIV